MASKKPAVFGSEEQPLRASALPALFQCSKGFVLKTMLDGTLESNEYADTGNMVHTGIQVFHQMKGNEIAAKLAVEKSIAEYKHGSITDALSHLKNYIKREKEDRRGEIIESEYHVKIKIKASRIDPTKKDIMITGTVDQIRKLGDWYYVVDFKTGYKEGTVMIREHTPQLAAYLIGVHEKYKTDKVKAFIARTRDLVSSRNPYYWQMPFGIERAHKIMDMVASKVAVIRQGILEASSGKHCDYCPSKWYYPDCVDETGQHRPPVEHKVKGAIALPQTAAPIKSVSELFGM